MNMVRHTMGGMQMGSTKAMKHGVKLVSIKRLIEWAFQKELASLDFNEVQSSSGWVPTSVSMEYRMMEQARLGCRVDGGGRSDPHPDADIVASALAALPEARGGRRTALWVAELARAGREPDWMDGAVPRCVPVTWKQHKHGNHAATEICGVHEYQYRGRKRKVEIRCCPVTYSPSSATIAGAQRAYLHWYAALLELRATFQFHSNLTSFAVSDQMPMRMPWKK